MSTDHYIQNIFRLVDTMDGAGLASMMTGDGIFRFANMPPVEGREAITAFLDNFFQSIKGIAHDRLEDWKVGETRFATGRVSYTRHDDSKLQVPFSVILKMQGELINEYLIFVDASELYTQK
ncbi:MAG: nuclear transport factor 2 family protein [Bacteroidales bacterium]|jgi:ketosteroid isomerase-like protein|nr:nuclear transport factor 2 family protein [Bacteroidales bacterium]